MKALKQQINEATHHALVAKAEVKTIKDVVSLDTTSWRSETRTLIAKVARAQGDLKYIRDFTNEGDVILRAIIKFKWPIFIGLLTLTIALFILAPNLAKQAEEAGSLQLPSSADSQKAADMLEKAGASEDTISLVYPLKKPVDAAMKKEIQSIVDKLEALGKPVSAILNPFESKELEAQLVSKDQKTVLVPITVDGTFDEIIALADKIHIDILSKNQTVYLTGEAIIGNDVNQSAQDGLKKTEIITVVLIFGLLLIVFRSIVTPFIPLIAVGISYLLSQSFVAFFIDWFGFPVSNYTQIFLVTIITQHIDKDEFSYSDRCVICEQQGANHIQRHDCRTE